jgi:hypothetical protein
MTLQTNAAQGVAFSGLINFVCRKLVGSSRRKAFLTPDNMSVYIHGSSGFEPIVAMLDRFETRGISSTERLWGPTGLLFNGCRGLFPRV